MCVTVDLCAQAQLLEAELNMMDKKYDEVGRLIAVVMLVEALQSTLQPTTKKDTKHQ